MNNSIYNQIFITKNQSQIPLLRNGKSLESRYNPEAEAQKQIDIINEKYSFFVVFGLASGIFVSKLNKKYPFAQIIVIEAGQDDFDFLAQMPVVSELKQKQNITFCSLQTLYKSLINLYIPAFYGNLKIIQNKAWVTENTENSLKCEAVFNLAMEDISKDYSVQAHFGKIWQNNIFNNLRLLQKKQNVNIKVDLTKTAVILAAGPSLEQNIEQIIKQRDKYFVISTDTSYSSAKRYNLFCDCVVSIDGQNVSANHFYGYNDTNTLFVFDLCANYNASKYLIENGNSVLFCINNHPLSVYASQKLSFFQLESGAGTVTIAAVDFAAKLGFKKIQVLAADFSYINGKPYTKETYLDSIFSSVQSKLSTREMNFVKLMFRTPVIKTNKGITTEILKSYQNSFEQYLASLNAAFRKENGIYKINFEQNKAVISFPQEQYFDFNLFIREFQKNSKNNQQINVINEQKNTDICLLPLISWLRNIDNIKDRSFSEYLEKAYIYISRYF